MRNAFSKLTPEEQAFRDGETSYPNKRINYPNDLQLEDHWLQGFYHAQSEASCALDDIDWPLGRDTFAWEYRYG